VGLAIRAWPSVERFDRVEVEARIIPGVVGAFDANEGAVVSADLAQIELTCLLTGCPRKTRRSAGRRCWSRPKPGRHPGRLRTPADRARTVRDLSKETQRDVGSDAEGDGPTIRGAKGAIRSRKGASSWTNGVACSPRRRRRDDCEFRRQGMRIERLPAGLRARPHEGAEDGGRKLVETLTYVQVALGFESEWRDAPAASLISRIIFGTA